VVNRFFAPTQNGFFNAPTQFDGRTVPVAIKFDFGSPPEPMPPPVKEPPADAPENPDVPVREPDPDEPFEI